MNTAHSVVVALGSLVALSPIAASAATLAVRPTALGVSTQACARGPASATIVAPWYPVVPKIVEGQHVDAPYGSADVVIVLDERGDVTTASILSSTRNPMLDRAAVVAARRTKYALAPTGCTSGATPFIVQVDFDPAR